ncbi:ABC transporter permease subunit [Erysipelothrix sp. HDW6C]|uniref:ABC transporter permease n=1 Tax=Erysipelothrix sp. HDW6C TaxID=2714930 RepID=UPI00140B5747|nr:ABC transporter permease [Erysipelothrix sp. HDW6C]QIK70641.1 ABC transporter permease subunit [Erysipelothrix sp. HDW6C]
MINYIKAELYRLRRTKSVRLVVIASCLFLLLTIGSVSGEVDVAIAGYEFQNLVWFIIATPIFAYVYLADTKNRTLGSILSMNVSKLSYILGKLIISILWLLFYYIVFSIYLSVMQYTMFIQNDTNIQAVYLLTIIRMLRIICAIAFSGVAVVFTHTTSMSLLAYLALTGQSLSSTLRTNAMYSRVARIILNFSLGDMMQNIISGGGASLLIALSITMVSLASAVILSYVLFKESH